MFRFVFIGATSIVYTRQNLSPLMIMMVKRNQMNAKDPAPKNPKIQ